MIALLLSLAAISAQTAKALPPADPIEADWIAIPDDELLIFTLQNGRTVTVRLAPGHAPVHIANIRRLAVAHWWDAGTSVYRVHDNYVAQWGDPTEKKPLPADVVATPPPEYVLDGDTAVVKLSKADPYSRWAGYSRDGWPLAGNTTSEWLPHCYAMVGVGRDLAPSTGTGAELYTVIGHSPRALDRNIALVGRVIDGMDALSALPRGTGNLGFLVEGEAPMPIVSARLASDMPSSTRPRFEYRATDNPRFAAWVRSRENRTPPFFDVPAGGVDICAAMPPVRRTPE